VIVVAAVDLSSDSQCRLCDIDPRLCRHAVLVFGAFREVAKWDTPLTISIKSYTRASFADAGRNTEQD
jgi:hypothetical protein